MAPTAVDNTKIQTLLYEYSQMIEGVRKGLLSDFDQIYDKEDEILALYKKLYTT